MDNTLIFNNKNGKEIVFYGLNLNDDKLVTFKSDNASIINENTEVILNEKIKGLEIRNKKDKKTTIIYLDKGYEDKYSYLINFKKEVLSKLSVFGKSLLSGEEKIIAFPILEVDGNTNFFVTTPDMIDHGHLSIKYYRGLEYCANRLAKELGKDVAFNCIDDIQRELSKALNLMLKEKIVILENLDAKDKNSEKVIKTTLRDVISMLEN